MPGLSEDGGLTLVHVTQRKVTPVPLHPLFFTLMKMSNIKCEQKTMT